MSEIGGIVSCRWSVKVGGGLGGEIRSSLAGLRIEVVVEGPGQWKIGEDSSESHGDVPLQNKPGNYQL